MTTRFRRFGSRTIRPGLWLITISLLAMSGFRAMAAGQKGDTCTLLYNWQQAFAGMRSKTIGPFPNLPACDPLPLGVEAEHWIVLDEQCAECLDSNNRWIEMQTNLRYEWAIITADGGFFSPLANDTTLASTKATTQQVLWHPPALEPDDVTQVTILVTATNDDEDKEVALELTGVFTIAVQRKTVHIPIEIPGGATLERRLERNDHLVLFTSTPVIGDGGTEHYTTCEPIFRWEEGAEIQGDFDTGDLANPTQAFLRDDLFVLSASGNDTDLLAMQCLTYNSICLPSLEQQIGQSDTLRFEWSSSLGSPEDHFPAGSIGREVVFSTKGALASQVGITLTISDIGLQYPDAPWTVFKSFPILSSEKSIDAAVIATVAPTALPGKDELPPPAAPGQAFEPTELATLLYGLRWPLATLSHVFKPQVFPNAWYARGELFGLMQWDQYHPWQHAVAVVALSGNDPPQESYPDFEDVRDWAEPPPGAGGAEHRGVYGVHLETYRRREIVQELPDPIALHLDVLLEHGWTPMTRGFVTDLDRDFGTGVGFGPPPYGRGDHRNQRIVMSGECTDTITFLHEIDVRLSQGAVEFSIWISNREPIWITTRLTAELNAEGPASLQHSSNPSFPTYDVYLGADGAELFKIDHKPQESAMTFIDRGDRTIKKGV